jgi:hypothetical protein
MRNRELIQTPQEMCGKSLYGTLYQCAYACFAISALGMSLSTGCSYQPRREIPDQA